MPHWGPRLLAKQPALTEQSRTDYSMSSAPARRTLSVAVRALIDTNEPTTDHYEAICKALETVAAQDFGIPIKVKLQADFSREQNA